MTTNFILTYLVLCLQIYAINKTKIHSLIQTQKLFLLFYISNSYYTTTSTRAKFSVINFIFYSSPNFISFYLNKGQQIFVHLLIRLMQGMAYDIIRIASFDLSTMLSDTYIRYYTYIIRLLALGITNGYQKQLALTYKPDFPTPDWPSTMTLKGFCFGYSTSLARDDFGEVALLIVSNVAIL